MEICTDRDGNSRDREGPGLCKDLIDYFCYFAMMKESWISETSESLKPRLQINSFLEGKQKNGIQSIRSYQLKSFFVSVSVRVSDLQTHFFRNLHESLLFKML